MAKMKRDFDAEFIKLINDARNSPTQNSRLHLQFEDLVAYIRIGRRYVPNLEYVNCVQLANLNIHNERKHQKGTFTRMLTRILQLTDMPIFVESIHNQGFGDALLRRGFVLISDQGCGVRDMILFRDNN